MSNTELKKVKGRVQNKHKTEADWLLDVYPNGDKAKQPRTDAFIPLAGELIVYDPDDFYDHPRFKIGDGIKNVDALPFETPIAAEDPEIEEVFELFKIESANI